MSESVGDGIGKKDRWRLLVVELLEQALECQTEARPDPWGLSEHGPQRFLRDARREGRSLRRTAERRAEELAWQTQDLGAALELARAEALEAYAEARTRARAET